MGWEVVGVGALREKEWDQQELEYHDTKNQKELCQVINAKNVRDTGNEIDLDNMQAMRQI